MESTYARSPTVVIETHGCKLNQADSALLGEEFVRAGFRLAGGREAADVYVVNSCTVTHVADRKARHALRAARRRNPEATIVAAGCYPQRDPVSLRGLSEVDLVIGNTGKPDLVRQVVEWRGGAFVPCSVGAEESPVAPRVVRTRAMVKIQEGCDQVCAYCIVPRVRGRERSVPTDRIVSEVRRRVTQGYKEVVLTGTQLGSYGFDLDGATLAGLIERVLTKTEVARLRVSSLQPREIDHDLLDVWSDARLCPHFHMPLQSGSDDILGRMRRRYSSGEYAAKVALIRDAVPGASVTADVIVGFPGESEANFRDTYRLCEDVGFASLHVFPYSTRPGTSAAHFRDSVDPPAKADRVRRLMSLGQDHAADFRRRLLGSVRPVLWEEPKPSLGRGAWVGLTDNYVRVVGLSERPLANEVTPARLTRQEKDLVHAQVL